MMTIEDQKILFSHCSPFSYNEAFKMLWEGGVSEIAWDIKLNNAYAGWMRIKHNLNES